MSQTSGAEEFDPATGEFRAIKRPVQPAPRKTAKAKPAKAPPPRPREIAGLSESGNRFGVFYEIFEGAAMSPAGTALYRGAQVVIAVIFALLIYEAVSYRIALGG